ncbi:hypothetical protein GNI_041640 [Gregarina niphandrodes]|uniref:Uncharacterized protein n=1 Tax=Gregarina niphandrodes TaxID=110365 RepID=A0A023BA56_GRENI|nr:hypothetical protein GNI_041640 [Gregarina niphandrodes]EZG77686.1 hypothetical protein GNI_041640 [Gregarina niphandrodes]|eukprot:XP_011129485.1 hypothetical protein GNI_041640 [Gregarina niphandrodes]
MSSNNSTLTDFNKALKDVYERLNPGDERCASFLESFRKMMEREIEEKNLETLDGLVGAINSFLSN